MRTDLSKTWMYTWCNYTQDSIELMKSQVCNRHVCGKEVCPSTQTPHLQGRITFKRTRSFNALKAIDKHISWRIAKYEECDYEYKEGDICIDIDNRKKKGERIDLASISEEIANGASEHDIATSFPSQFIRYHKGIRELIDIYKEDYETAEYKLEDCSKYLETQPIDFEEYNTSHIILGVAGIGKTQFALAHFMKALLVSHIDDLLKFNPSKNDGIVFDDMDFCHYPRNAQIHLLDWDNTRSIHCRYRTARIPKHTKKIFTCNEMCFDLTDDAILRRVTVTEVFKR